MVSLVGKVPVYCVRGSIDDWANVTQNFHIIEKNVLHLLD